MKETIDFFNFNKNRKALKYFRFFLFVLCIQSVTAAAQEKPKLVIGLVVDQMRWDYLYKYYDRFGEDGFKRVLNNGFSCENTTINYLPTHTAVGHTAVYTGSIPAVHGIVGNKWIGRESGTSVYCTEDADVVGAGTEGGRGKHSPKNLLASTVTDELKLASNFKSKVIGVSIKDRGGILPAGHFADAAYWFEPGTGNWISSSYYMEDLPQWIKDFNAQKLPEIYIAENWALSFPSATYTLSLPETNPYKGQWPEKEHNFPHKLSEIVKEKNSFSLMFTIPSGNTMTFELSKEAIEKESLGNNLEDFTDFLAISLSSTDFIGHKFGVSSVEVEDTYIKLDRDLGAFLKYLDAKIGRGDYLLFITADHGASYNPKYYSDIKGEAGYFLSSTVKDELNEKIKEELGIKGAILSIKNYHIYLNNALLEKENTDIAALKFVIRSQLFDRPGIAYVIDFKNDLDNGFIPRVIKDRVSNGYHSRRSGDMQIITDPQWYDDEKDATGTEHGTWISYDAHIPLLFYGYNIEKGKTYRQIHITDIASTLSSILKIIEPNGSVGKPIVELLK